MGGLGNQMFQYAAGRRLAIKHKTILKLDLTFLMRRKQHENFTHRNYALDAFGIQENFVGPLENKIHTVEKILKLINVVNEPPHHFHESILSAPDNSYLVGYWQSEKYFKDVEDIIRNEFTVKFQVDSINKEITEEINSCEAVSVHIRRGDYVSNPVTNEYHGLCPLDYYQKALSKITSCTNNPHFFIFSDDPEWAQKNLNIEYPIKFITHNGAEKSYDDLRLMSLCRHNIIANSSFSWWGAWLNKNPEKIVIAPRKWFKDSSINTNDLIPENWIRI